MELIGLAAAYALGADPRRLVVLGGLVSHPWLGLAALGIVLWMTRREDGHRPALFCAAVSSELRAGATLRDALASASRSLGEETLAQSIARVGINESADDVAGRFSPIGDELRAAVRAAAEGGGRAADLFDDLAGLAISIEEVRHELKVAAAPAQAAGAVFAFAPALYIAWRAGSGTLGNLMATPAQRAVALVGALIFIVGLIAAAVLLWRAR